MALHHVKPGEIADVAPFGAKFADAKTCAIAKTNMFEAIRLVIKDGSEVPAHKVPGEITLHCLEGRVDLKLDDRNVELSASQWIYLEGGRLHAFKAREDSSLLMTILFPR